MSQKTVKVFSEKDFIGNVCFSGDILRGKYDEIYFLFYDKNKWVLLKQDPLTGEFDLKEPQEQASLLTRVESYAVRICSVLDKMEDILNKLSCIDNRYVKSKEYVDTIKQLRKVVEQ